MKKLLAVSALVTLALLYGGIAQANTISGNLWHISEGIIGYGGSGAIPANLVGLGTPYVTFDVNSPFDFNAGDGGSATVATWLATSGAFNIVENTAGTLASLMSTYGLPSSSNLGTIVYFTGDVTVTNGETFDVEHDDGLTLIINGLTVVNAPGPTAPTLTSGTYSGVGGTWPFQLVYGECCGGPAVLEVGLPLSNPVPEPATMLLLGSGLIGLAGYGRKKFSKK